MTELDLEAGKTLLHLIKTTEKALDELNKWMNARGVLSESDSGKGFNLVIGEHRDGSGYRLDLSRVTGNPQLLFLIRAELESQLDKFKNDFDNL